MNYLEHPHLKPLVPLLTDPSVSEIMINGPTKLFVERRGAMALEAPIFTSSVHLDMCMDSLIGFSGRAINASQPFVDFRLPDGSRVNIVIAPVALDGPVITIRRAVRSIKKLEDIVRTNALTPRMAKFLQVAVAAHCNIVFSGGAGSGKTTLLAMLSESIDPAERIIVMEDTAELDIQKPHVIRMECRPPNIEGQGRIVLAELLKNSLRMRPTRIVVGEVRGEEAFDLLSAFSSGHEGGFAVLHASSPMQAVSRLEMMVLARGLPYPLWAIQNQIAAGIDFIVQQSQLADGTRKVTNITAVQGRADDAVVLHDIFHWDFEDQRFMTDGNEPACLAKMRRIMPNIGDMLGAGPA